MDYTLFDFPEDILLALYRNMLLPRKIEEKMLVQLRKGKISKWFSGIGQEAIAAGATMAIQEDEYILPLHRNLGVFTSRNIPLNKLFKQFQGKKSGFTKGRDRSFHFGTNEHHIWGMISHLGPQLSIGAGIALGYKLNRKQKVALAFTGEGGTSEGEFHEALNVASVWNLPVIFLIENNGYGLSTPSSEQYKCEKLSDRAVGYGMEGYTIDGNNVLEVYHTVNEVATKMRLNPRPVLLECMTFRMRGHEEASGTKYVPQHLFDEWQKKDPIGNYERYLREKGILNDALIEEINNALSEEIDSALKEAFGERSANVNAEEELADVFAPHVGEKMENKEIPDTHNFSVYPQTNEKNHLRLVDALSEGLRQSMEKYGNLIIMGQDVAEYGGVFKITEGFLDQFGKDRVRNTPLCEEAILGIGLGMTVEGYKSVIEMQFADFVSMGFNQIVNNLAKVHYRWGQNADVVVRMPTGAGVGAGPFHSQSDEAWFFHVPGLKIVYPATAMDAKGLLSAAIEDPNPVMYFEHKYLYRSVSEEVYKDYFTVEIGKARRLKEGNEISIITYGMGVHWALEVANESEYSIDILDLRSLMPWDKEAVEETINKTGKVLILHEDTLTGGIGAEISAYISEHYFEYLDAPVIRVASLDTPVPFTKNLEEQFLAKSRLNDRLKWLAEY